jgi:hypothetical protein
MRKDPLADYECDEQAAKFNIAPAFRRRGEKSGAEPGGRRWSFARVKNIFDAEHFFVACRGESCILRMRVRFTATTRAKIV